MRRLLLSLIVIVGLLAPAACANKGGNKESFCKLLPQTGDAMAILGDFGTDNSKALEKRTEEGLAKFRELEKAAPRDIRSDVANVGDAMEQVLKAVRRHPDDTAAIRTELAGKATQFVGAGKSAVALSRYAQKECGISLDSVDPGASTGTTVP